MQQLRTCLLLAFGYLALCVPARADMAAQDLLQACKQMDFQGHMDGVRIQVPDRASSGVCIGFFSAVVGTTLFRNADDSPVLGICTPDHVSVYDLIRATEHFVTVDPRRLTDRAIIVVLSAAKLAYPCGAGRQTSNPQ